MQTRLLLYHRHPVSSRTLFLRFPHGGVCGIEPLPERSWYEEGRGGESRVAVHPAFTLTSVVRFLGIDGSLLELESGFHERVVSDEGEIIVFLARFTTLDAPFTEVDPSGCSLIEMQDIRALRRVEQGLLGRVYDFAIGTG